MMKALLVTDLDETLLGDEAATARLFELVERLEGRLAVAVATGRSVQSALERLASERIPVDRLVALATSVGCELYLDGGQAPDEDYAALFRNGWSCDAVVTALEGLNGLEAQPQPDQRPFKVSYFVDADSTILRTRVTNALSAAGLVVGTTFSQGRFLDVMPRGMSKGSAAEYLACRFGLSFDAAMTAGDSGNDTAMLKSRCLATVVGNHFAELEELRGMPRVYFARASHADGIIEGLEHWSLV